MKTIVGLGNPGRFYEGTRHNVGSWVVKALVQRHGVALRQRLMEPKTRCWVGLYGDYHEGSEDVRLLIPRTMMNESGRALRAANLETQALLIVLDDVNLPLGCLRLRPRGSAGGHHGLLSCLDALNTEQVGRLRIGVGRETMPKDLRGFVLGTFVEAERPLLEHLIERAGDACDVWIKEGMDAAMNRYNG